MADPISIAVATLAKAFLTGMGTAAGRDAYYALRSALVYRYPTVVPTIEELERDPGSRELREQLTAALHKLYAENDKTLQQLAMRLRETIEYGNSADPVDQLKRVVGFGQLWNALNEHLELIMRIQANYRVNSSDLLSSNISRATDVPNQVRADVRELHGRIRKIIEHFAWVIEGGKYGDTDDLIKSLPARNTQERATRLVQADKELHVSYETLRLTVGFFGDFNVAVLEAIEQAPSKERQMQMMFGNAVMLYELADYVIGFVEKFTPGGLRDLEDLHQEAQRHVETIRAAQQRLIEKTNQDEIDQGVREGILSDVRGREEGLKAFQQEWENYIAEAKQLYSPVGDVRRKVPSLEAIRDNAGIQIEMLELVAMLRFLKKNTDSIRAAVDVLRGFRLAPLDAERVRRLVEP